MSRLKKKKKKAAPPPPPTATDALEMMVFMWQGRKYESEQGDIVYIGNKIYSFRLKKYKWLIVFAMFMQHNYITANQWRVLLSLLKFWV